MRLKWVGLVGLVLVTAGAASGGELILRSGTRLPAELAYDMLVISTGAAVVEVAPEHVVTLSRDEVRLRDGRVIRGTLVGSVLKARTSLGELAVKLDDLELFRSDDPGTPVQTAPEAAGPAPGLATTPAAPSAPAAADASSGPARVVEGTKAPADAPSGPAQIAEGTKKVGGGFEDAAKGVARTVVEGADRLHDGAKALGTAILEKMKAAGRVLRDALGGS